MNKAPLYIGAIKTRSSEPCGIQNSKPFYYRSSTDTEKLFHLYSQFHTVVYTIANIMYSINILKHLLYIKQWHYFVNKGPSSQDQGFSSSRGWMWELDYKESWAPENWCFWTAVLEKTLESSLDCKEIQPVHPKGEQSWVFIRRTDIEAESPILWPPDAKSWLIGKDPDAGKDWGLEEKGMTG